MKTKKIFRLLVISPFRHSAISPFRLLRKGQMAIMLVLTSLLFLLIMLPVIETYVRNEVKGSVAEKKKTTAFHLAEAGIDRGYWKLIENTSNWTTIIQGGSISGYANDKIHTDISGGSYTIDMLQGSSIHEVVIVATGKVEDAADDKYRAIRAVYSKQAVKSALQAASIGATGNVIVYWGPIMSTGNMDLKGGANELYPRKYARGSITKGTGGGGGNYGTRDNNPNPANKGPYTDGVTTEWWSYNESPGVPDILTPDTSYYSSLAQSQGYYYATDQSINNLVDSTCTVGSDSKVRFFAGNLSLGGNMYFCGVLIVLGNLTITGGGKSPDGDITVTPPSEAWKEYQVNVPVHSGDTDAGTDMTLWTYEPGGTHPGSCDGPHRDTDATDEYPGDNGYHTRADYNFDTGRVGCSATPQSLCRGGASQGALAFKGYIYVGGTYNPSGGTRIFGSVQVAGTSGVSGGGDIFYDDNLEIRFLNNNITRTSWYEITPTPF